MSLLLVLLSLLHVATFAVETSAATVSPVAISPIATSPLPIQTSLPYLSSTYLSDRIEALSCPACIHYTLFYSVQIDTTFNGVCTQTALINPQSNCMSSSEVLCKLSGWNLRNAAIFVVWSTRDIDKVMNTLSLSGDCLQTNIYGGQNGEFWAKQHRIYLQMTAVHDARSGRKWKQNGYINNQNGGQKWAFSICWQCQKWLKCRLMQWNVDPPLLNTVCLRSTHITSRLAFLIFT